MKTMKKMLHYVVFHLGLNCLAQYRFKGLSKFGLFKSDYTQVKINKNFQRKNVNIILLTSFNICFGCSE